jgi:hypothetical protein
VATWKGQQAAHAAMPLLMLELVPKRLALSTGGIQLSCLGVVAVGEFAQQRVK